MTANEIREAVIAAAKKESADLIGFAPAERFDDPALKKIYPGCKTVICVLFRVLRGSYRGVEEGTTYYQYTTTGVETMEETILPGALLRVCAAIEDAGYTAIPQKKNQLIRPSKEALRPEMLHTEWNPVWAREPQLDFTKAAVLCGLGEIGFSGALLTDEFGPFQRVGLVLTDAELPADPVKAPHLCDKCGACRAACPGHAIREDGKVDLPQCGAYYRGANMHTNPYMPADAYPDIPNRLEIMDGKADLSFDEACKVMNDTHFYPPVKQGYVSSVCGRACDRACYVHLEEKGALTREFLRPFRKRPGWSLPLIDEEEEKNN